MDPEASYLFWSGTSCRVEQQDTLVEKTDKPFKIQTTENNPMQTVFQDQTFLSSSDLNASSTHFFYKNIAYKNTEEN